MKNLSEKKPKRNTGESAEKSIYKWKKRYELITEASGQIVYDYCVNDGSIEWGGSIEKILGYKLSEMTGGLRRWKKLIHEDDLNNTLRLLKESGESLKPFKAEYRLRHKEGYYVDILDRGFYFVMSENEDTRLIGTMLDITVKKRSERLINALNSAVISMQNVNTQEGIYNAVNSELKKINFKSFVMSIDSEKRTLKTEYYSYNEKLIKVAEKLVGMKMQDLYLNIKDIEEYDDVINSQKTVFVNTSNEFVKNILPGKLRLFSDKLIKMFKVSRFIMAPLVVDKKIIGTFSVQAEDLTESDIPAVTIFAHQLAGAWHKAKLIEDAEKELRERKLAEEALKESENKSRTIIEQLFEGFVLINDNGKIIEWNNAMERITGTKMEEVVNEYFWDVQFKHLLPERKTHSNYDKFKEMILKALKGRDTDMFNRAIEMPIINSEGETKIMQSVIFPIMLGDKFFVGDISRDITENVQSKKALQESEEKMQSIFRVAPTGIAIVKDRITMDINLKICEMTGYSKKELVGRDARVFYPTQEEYDYIGNESYSQIKDKGTGIVETRWKKKNGEIINVILSATAIDPKNTSKGFIFTVLDITERKKAEEALIKSQKRLSLFFNQSLDGFYFTMLDEPKEWSDKIDKEEILDYSYYHQRIVEINDAMLKQYGAKREELIGKPVSIFFEHDSEYGRNYRRKLFDDGHLHVETKELKFDGTPMWVEGDYVCLYDEEHRITGTFGIQRDITKRKRAEEELIKAKEKAEEMSRVKSSFLANMSHEVRTPLVAILGFSEVLSELIKEEELKNYVEMIHKGGERLLDTLNLILDLSVIESQKIKIELTPLDIVKEVKDVISLFKKTAERKKLILEFNSYSDSVIINLDTKILRQIMNNLVNNAIKYTNVGRIDVNISIEKKDEKEYVAIRIEDTGIGIPKDKQSLIWEEFRQVSEGLSRSFEGTGLGLSITKKFVEKLNGSIFLEKSEENVGSTFTVLFPVEAIPPVSPVKKQKNIENIKSLNDSLPVVLYVEDDPVSVDIVKSFGGKYCKVEGASTGNEGIEKAKKKIYDAVLMDINLGFDMNGIQATKEIRKIPGYESVPIVAITAFAMIGDREEFYECGCTHYISKPFTKIDIVELLKNVLK